jgi:hypothetical protein
MSLLTETFTTLDAAKWTENDPNSIMAVTGGVVACSASGSGDKIATLSSIFQLTGDFDIQVDFSNTTLDSVGASVHYIGFRITDGTNYAQIARTRSIGTNGHAASGTGGIFYEIASAYASGKLRITRIGDDLTAYYWNGSDWVWGASTSGRSISPSPAVGDIVSVVLYFKQESNSTLIADYDNFVINSGTIVGPTGEIETNLPLFSSSLTGNAICETSLPLFSSVLGPEAFIVADLPLFESAGEFEAAKCEVSLPLFEAFVRSGDAKCEVDLPLFSSEILGNAVCEVSIPAFSTELLGNATCEVSLPLFTVDDGSYIDKAILFGKTSEIWTEPSLPLFSTFGSTQAMNAVSPYKIVIDHTKFSDTLPNFPIRIHLSSSGGANDFDASGLFAVLASGSNRKKIAVTLEDMETQCYVEIEPGYDFSAPSMNLWVKVPFVSSVEDTVLYLFFDPSMTDNTTYVGDTLSTPAMQVWDSSYLAVYHMAQEPTAANSLKNSVSNQYHGTPSTFMNAGDLVAGPIGKGINFDHAGGTTKITFGSGDSSFLDLLLGNNLTVEALAKPVNGAAMGRIINMDNSYYWVPWAINAGRSDGTCRANLLRVDEHKDTYQTASLYGEEGDDSIYIAGRINIGENLLTIHVNLDKDSVSFGTGLADPAYFGTPTPWMGCRTNGNGKFYGVGDEVRISKVDRSDAWVNATYYSLVDQLLNIEVVFDQEAYDLENSMVFHSSNIYNLDLPLFRAHGLTNAILNNVVLPKFRSFIGFAAEIEGNIPRFRSSLEGGIEYIENLSVHIPKFKSDLIGVAGRYINGSASLPRFRTIGIASSNRPGTIAARMAKFVSNVKAGTNVSGSISAMMPIIGEALRAKSDKEFFKLMYRQRPWD